LSEAEARVFFFQRTQNGRGASNDLNLTFVVGDKTTHDAFHPLTPAI